MNEHKVQDKFQKMMRSKGYKVIPLNDGFTSGIPDNYVAKAGWSAWFELKVIHGRPGDTIFLDDEKAKERGFTRSQALMLYELKTIGGINAYGLAYLEYDDIWILIKPEQMKKPFKYEELLSFPRMEEILP